MYVDVVKLRDWYRTPTGHVVRRVIQQQINAYWPSMAGKRLLVLGYGEPYIGLIHKEANVVCGMPGKMGVIHWPRHEPNRSFLSWMEELPLPDQLFDNILMLHGLEFCENADAVLNECNRVLKHDGSMLIAVPNRTGPWAQRDVTPMGRGHPYTLHQLSRIARDASFIIHEGQEALFVPPTRRQWLLNTWETWENIGRRFWPMLGGVVVADLRKDLYGSRAVRVAYERERRAIRQPIGVVSTPLVETE